MSDENSKLDEFQVLIDKLIKKEINAYRIDLLAKDDLKMRWIQEIYHQNYESINRDNGYFYSSKMNNGSLDGFHVENDDLIIKKTKFLKELFLSFSYISYIFFRLFILKIFFKKIEGKINLLLGNPFRDEINKHSIKVLNQKINTISINEPAALTWFIQQDKEQEFSFLDKKFIFTRIPLLECIRNPNISLIYSLVISFKGYFLYLITAIKYPQFAILWKDIIELYLADYFEKSNLISRVIFTNASIRKQELWTRKINRNYTTSLSMYSVNSHRYDPFHNNFRKLYFFKLSTFDEIEVWNQYHRKILEDLEGCKSRFKLAYPIVWSGSKQIRPSEKKIISIFDVTPYDKQQMLLKGMPIDFYQEKDFMISFVKDIVNCYVSSISNKDNFMIYIKTKSINSPSIDKEYIKDLKGLISHSQRNDIHIKLLDESYEINSLISNSMLTISAPITSSAPLAKLLNKNAIYYDPSFKLKYNELFYHGIQLISGQKDLSAVFRSL